MVKKNGIKIICFIIFFLMTTNQAFIGVAYSVEFDIDEIITAIKQEIQTANIAELGSPNFKIENVDVVLSVFSTETEKGEIYVKIDGFSSEVNYEILNPRSFHNLGFSFQPTGAFSLSPEASLGLVEPIKKVKSALRKAYNTPPSFNMEDLTFRMEFAIEKNMDGGLRFKIIELEDLGAQNITTHQITLHMKIKK